MKGIKVGEGIISAIGNTPLVHLSMLNPTYKVNLYGKMEGLNPGGSIKDRTANSIITEAINSGRLCKGSTVIESSSGNMAIGLAQLCLFYGFRLIVVVDSLINKQTLKILKAYGATVDLVNPGINESNLEARLRRVTELMDIVDNGFWPNQYANISNPEAHISTISEIVEALDGKLDYLFAATSTCGTIMGCASHLRHMKIGTKIVAVDAKGSMIFNDEKANRLIPGHGAGRKSELLDLRLIDQVVHISDRECVIGCHQLLNREAILAGGSSGAIVMAVQKLLPEIPEGSNCALILCDSGERYLDTVYNPEWVGAHFGNIHDQQDNLESPVYVR